MMLDWHEKKPEPVEELDSIERGDSHVEEDTEYDGVWHEPEQRRQKDGKSDEQGYAQGRDTLIFDVNNFGRFSGLVSCRHHGEGGQVGDGSDGGRTDPGSSEKCTRNVEHAEEDDVPVKAAPLLALVH